MSDMKQIQIFADWKREAIAYFAIIAQMPHLLLRTLQSPNIWRDFYFYLLIAFIASGLYALLRRLRGKPFLNPMVVIDDKGVRTSRVIRLYRWEEIEACAVNRDKKRRVLRLFLRETARRRFDKPFVDIFFAPARDPDAALDRAFRACVARLAARHADPVRPFVDDAKAAALHKPLGARFMWGFALAVTAISGLILWTFQRPVIHERPMPVDDRPVKKVLMLGNSRITVNDLGWTIRDMADSAHSPIRWDFSMLSWASATLREHWKYQGDHDEIAKGYDYVLLQPESGAFETDSAADSTSTYGGYLIGAAKQAGSEPLLLSGPSRGEQAFEGDDAARSHAVWEYGKRIDSGARQLAEKAQAGMIDLTSAFEVARRAVPQVSLSDGGTNPSHAGTYLMALMIYRHLSHDDLAKVTWRPYDLPPEVAEIYKRIAMKYGD